MSYGQSAPLQYAVYQHITTDAQVSACVGDAIYDVPPAGLLPEIYVLIGQEDVRDASDSTGVGAWHDITLSIICNGAGFLQAKQAAGAISDALHDAKLSLSRGQLVGMRFRKAKAARGKEGHRRIDVVFRTRVEDI